MAYDLTRTRTGIKWLAIDTDLRLLLAYAIITAATAFLPFIDQTPIVSILGFGMVIFVPGYALLEALFPGKGGIGGLERAVLSSGISLMAAALTGTALYFSPLGFTAGLMYVCLAAFTIAGVVVAVKRRPATGNNSHPRASLNLMSADRRNLALALILTLCILASVSFLSYAVLVPKQGETFTEFYVLGPDGKAGNYPVRMHLGDTAPLIVGVANHEHSDMSYDLVVLLSDSVNESRLYEENVTVVKGQIWEKKIELKPDLTGTDLKIELLLYAAGNHTAPYRDLHLQVDVLTPLY